MDHLRDAVSPAALPERGRDLRPPAEPLAQDRGGWQVVAAGGELLVAGVARPIAELVGDALERLPARLLVPPAPVDRLPYRAEADAKASMAARRQGPVAPVVPVWNANS